MSEADWEAQRFTDRQQWDRINDNRKRIKELEGQLVGERDINDNQAREIVDLAAELADLKDSVQGLLSSMILRIVDIEELRAFKDAMAEAANVLQAESSPRIPYIVGPGTYDVDDFMDTRWEVPR